MDVDFSSAGPYSALPSTFQEMPQQSASKCSRYQFECRRGGECIAVYNACDGVPQCADGSDEAPELGCPAPAPPPAAPTAPPPSPPAPPRWPHRLTLAQPQHRYNEAAPSSHIFSHKGGLLQETEPAPAPAQYPPFEPPAPPPAPWPQRGWPQQQTGLENMGGWGPGGGGGGYSRLEWAEQEPRRAWPVPVPVPGPRPDDAAMYNMPPPSKTMPEIPIVYSSRQQTLRDGPKKGLEVAAPPPAAPTAPPDHREEDPPPPPPPQTTAHINPHIRKSEAKVDAAAGAGAGAGAGAAERHLAGDEHDGLSEHPPAAVLLLVIGVGMTGAMGAMVGCRARAAARRRLRRGKPFAHDADYLVNGMYL